MAARVHLVRHGEVDNPRHLVYASLPGFDLSPAGAEQARATARYLGRQPVVAVWSSPLERALRTAEIIAGRADQPVRVDPGLTEWGLMDRWAGVAWEDIPGRFPGELEAFLHDPTDLSFSPEGLADLAGRAAATIRRLDETYPHGDVVVVSHSAPVRAAAMSLAGEDLRRFWEVDPPHCSVTTMQPGQAWEVETIWSPTPS